jgi:hypothetical protein
MSSLFMGLLLAVQASAEDRVADYTFWLMVFTAALATISAIQIWFLIRSDNTARMSAEAAKKSAEVAEAALVAGTRAIVSTAGFTAFWESGADANQINWRFRPKWRNDGKTPTQNMTLYSDCELRNSLLPILLIQQCRPDRGTSDRGPRLWAVTLLAGRQSRHKISSTLRQRENFFICGGGLVIEMSSRTQRNTSARFAGGFCHMVTP